MMYKYWYGMGSDMFLKAPMNPTTPSSFKTRLIIEQLDIHNSFNFGWREISAGKVKTT